MDVIGTKSANAWQKLVYEAAERKTNRRFLKNATKRKEAILENEHLSRKPEAFINKYNKLIARAYIMGRYGMLQSEMFKRKLNDVTCR